MKKILSVLIASCTLFVLSGVASAESYISAYAGGAIPHDSDVTVNTGGSLGSTGELTFKTSLAGGIKLGHWFTDNDAPYLGIQLDANAVPTDLKTLNTSSGVIADATGNAEFYSLMASVLVRRPEGKVRPYAGLGAGWVWANMGIGAFFPNTYSLPARSVTEGAFGWQVLVGLDNPFNEKLSWFLEYKFSASELDLGSDYGLDLDYMSSQLYAGLSYSF